MPFSEGSIIPAPGATLMASLRLALSDIKLAHSVFALPFALLGALIATPVLRESARWGTLAGQVALVVLCMFLARTWAMLVNRIADADFDSRNPRTARRVIASGRLGRPAAVGIASGFGLGFIGAAGAFWVLFDNPWPLLLSVPVLAWIAFYSFTKRFTSWCHVFLGGALAASPPAAALAVDPGFLLSPAGGPIWLLSAMVVCWVAGFDIAYALQDVEFDRAERLHSVPARFGIRGSLWLSRGLHVAAFGLLVLAVRAEPRFGLLTWAGVACVGALLAVEHAVLARRGVAGLPVAFFAVNGLVSLTLGLAGSVDLILSRASFPQ